MAKKFIDDEPFEEKIDGMTLVDAFYIPDTEVENYIKDREYYAIKASEIFAKYCAKVERDFAGSQDGEAITGLNEKGEMIAIMHLDPDGIEMMRQAEKKGVLEEELKRDIDL